MANTHENLTELFSGIAAAIRSKTGSTAKIKADNFPSAINAIEAGSGGITPVDTITIIANGNYDVTQYAEAVVAVSANTGACEHTEVEQATPSITVSSSGLIKATSTQEAGLVSGGTKTAQKQLTTVSAQTIRPGTADQTIDAGIYLTGVQTIKGDANLVSENIRAGVSIFDVPGTCMGGGGSGGSDADNEFSVDSLSELHAWDKYTIGGTITEESVTDITLFTKLTSSSTIFEITYADSYAIVDDAISLVNPTTAEIGSDTASRNAIKGKYIKTSESSNVYYIPSDARVAYGNYTMNKTIEVDKATRITYSGASGSFIGIVISEDSTAYPQNGTQDGYKYVYNGTLDSTNCTHTSVAQATPVITVSSGVITATSTQSAGLVSAGTKTATKSDANLVAGNIKQGVTIFGVTGTYAGGSEGENELDGAYVWQKCTIDTGWHYTTEELGTTKPSDATGSASKSFTITDDGYFELSTETTYLGGYYSISGGNGKSIYYGVYTYNGSNSYTKYYKLTLSDSMSNAKGQFVGYVTSDSENAYPDNGASGGYWYVKLVAVDA